jgi:hypothetical protein
MITGCVSQKPVFSTMPGTQEETQSTTSKQKEFKTPCLLKETKPRPSWVDNPVNSNTHIFGVGAAPKQDPVSRQIQAARILAMRNISEQIKVYVEGIYEEIQTNNDSKIKDMVKQKTDSLLRNIKYDDQWNDVSSCTVYSLVSCPKLNH